MPTNMPTFSPAGGPTTSWPTKSPTQSILVNGDFEADPIPPENDYDGWYALHGSAYDGPNIQDWVGDKTVIIKYGAPAWQTPQHSRGDTYFACVKELGRFMEKNIAGLNVGKTYQLSFDAACRDCLPIQLKYP